MGEVAMRRARRVLASVIVAGSLMLGSAPAVAAEGSSECVAATTTHNAAQADLATANEALSTAQASLATAKQEVREAKADRKTAAKLVKDARDSGKKAVKRAKKLKKAAAVLLRTAVRERGEAAGDVRDARKAVGAAEAAAIGPRLTFEAACLPAPAPVDVPATVDLDRGVDAFPVPPGAARSQAEVAWLFGQLGGYQGHADSMADDLFYGSYGPVATGIFTFDARFYDSATDTFINVDNASIKFVAAWKSTNPNIAWIKYEDTTNPLRTCIAPYTATQAAVPLCIPGLNNGVQESQYPSTHLVGLDRDRFEFWIPDTYAPRPTLLNYSIGYLGPEVESSNILGEKGTYPHIWGSVEKPLALFTALPVEDYAYGLGSVPNDFVPNITVLSSIH